MDPAVVAEDAFALLLVAGVARSEVTFSHRSVSETLIATDLLLPAFPRGDGFATQRAVTALSWCVFARLDAHFLAEAARRPELMAELTRRLADQEHRIAVSGAISQLPRADDRIEATFAQLAPASGCPSRAARSCRCR